MEIRTEGGAPTAVAVNSPYIEFQQSVTRSNKEYLISIDIFPSAPMTITQVTFLLIFVLVLSQASCFVSARDERHGGRSDSDDKKYKNKKGSGPHCGTGSGGVSLDGKFSCHIVHGHAIPPLTSDFLGDGGVRPIASSGYLTFNKDGPCTCSMYGVRNFNGNNFGGKVIFSTECTYGFDEFGVGVITAAFEDTGASDFAVSVVSEEEFSFMRQDAAVLVGLCKKTYLIA